MELERSNQDEAVQGRLHGRPIHEGNAPNVSVSVDVPLVADEHQGAPLESQECVGLQ